MKDNIILQSISISTFMTKEKHIYKVNNGKRMQCNVNTPYKLL